MTEPLQDYFVFCKFTAGGAKCEMNTIMSGHKQLVDADIVKWKDEICSKYPHVLIQRNEILFVFFHPIILCDP